MKRFQFISCLFVFIVVYGCGTTQSTVSDEDRKELANLVEEKKFRIENDWANPTVTNAMMQVGQILGPQNNASRINLMSNPNFLEVDGDHVKAYLPYFGERQMGGGYNTNETGIKFDQVAEDMEIHYLEAKKKYKMTFKANNTNSNEAYNITLEVFFNKKTSLIINSTERNSIRYEGTLMPLSEN